MDFYYVPGSAPCRAVQMTAKAVGVELNLKLTNLMAGEHLKPEFVAVSTHNFFLFSIDKLVFGCCFNFWPKITFANENVLNFVIDTMTCHQIKTNQTQIKSIVPTTHAHTHTHSQQVVAHITVVVFFLSLHISTVHVKCSLCNCVSVHVFFLSLFSMIKSQN